VFGGRERNEFLVSNKPITFRLGELFCGPGGLACGAINAHIAEAPEFKIVHEWANDYDSDTCDTYFRNICNKDESLGNTVICQDVHTLDIEYLSQW